MVRSEDEKLRLVNKQDTDSRFCRQLSMRVDRNLRAVQFVDDQCERRLCSLDFTKPSTVFSANCRKNTVAPSPDNTSSDGQD